MTGLARQHGVRVLAWTAVALAAYPWAPPPPPPPGAGPIARWLGPVGSLAASVEWVRWGFAVQHGDASTAYAAAARALALDPVSPKGWLQLGQHLVLERSSPHLEPERSARASWVRRGFDVLRRGEERSSDGPGLAMVQGDLMVFLTARVGLDLEWPGGIDALLAEADGAYTRAAALGHPDAAERRRALAEKRRSAAPETGEPRGR
jgi:hypothetical protein